jgi:hypothetical protein
MSDSEPTSIGRNDPCYCGSGRKFKHCHGRERYEQEREQYRQKQFAKALEEQVGAGWRIESQSDGRAVVSRRQFGMFSKRRIIEVAESGKLSIERL